jgi:hypothetical protein
MSKSKIGDVIEIRTNKGLAYAQYTHKHPQYGGLIRVFDHLFSSRPSKFDKLVQEPVRFSTFIPVTAATKRGIFKIVGHEEIAHVNRVFPIFRTGSQIQTQRESRCGGSGTAKRNGEWEKSRQSKEICRCGEYGTTPY